MDIRKIYTYALQREREGKRFFEQNAERLSHAAAADALDRGDPADAAVGIELEKEGFFSQRAVSELLDQTVLEAMVPDLPVLRTAYLIERDFADFYAMAAGKAEGEAKRALEMLAQWERGHEAFFKQIHDRAFEEYAQMPWGG